MGGGGGVGWGGSWGRFSTCWGVSWSGGPFVVGGWLPGCLTHTSPCENFFTPRRDSFAPSRQCRMLSSEKKHNQFPPYPVGRLLFPFSLVFCRMGTGQLSFSHSRRLFPPETFVLPFFSRLKYVLALTAHTPSARSLSR